MANKSSVDFHYIEQKWQKKWQNKKVFEPKVDENKEKYFIIFAYPGISGYLHVGHMRGYSITDVVARYHRMLGKNVFFPVGTHASGNIAISFANKIKNRDEKWINYLVDNGCPKDIVSNLTTPEKIIEFFNKEYVDSWKAYGFSSSWSAFTCTSFDDYHKFIEWQFKKFMDLGLLIQKPYFTTTCINCGPVAVDLSETDISKGGNAEVVEYFTIKFKLENNVLPAATLRPETLFGVVNMWINPEINYVRASVGSEIYIISKQAAEKLKYQEESVEIIEQVSGKELIGKYCENPLTKNKVIILPALFVDPNVGTGVVMSVPAHAPYDYIALKDIQNNNNLLDKFNLPKEEIKNIKQISLIKTQEFGEFPAEEICKKIGIDTQNEIEKLEQATTEIYLKEFSKGVLKEICGKYAGLKISEVKENLGADLLNQNLAGKIRDLSEEVICRCGGKVVIKKIPDQWFIKYSDKSITEKAKKQVDNMQIIPESFKKNFPRILTWFEDRACTRLNNWIGTKLPFDKKWIIEPIADSTIYPAYYIVSQYFNNKKISVDDLTEEFFDYVFLGKGKPKNEIWKEIHREFDYWYPLNMNIAGKEHKTVHFPVFLKSHIAIFPEKYWPVGIGANGWVTGKGKFKLSKSKGGAEPIKDIAKKYSVDGMRLYYLNTAELFSDIEWDQDIIIKYKKKLESIINLINELSIKKDEEEMINELSIKKDEEKEAIDKWILSKLNASCKVVESEFNKFNIKKASDEIFFNIHNLIKWYLSRGGKDKQTLEKVSNIWLRLMAPFTPHICEELWEQIGNKDFISLASYPQFDKSLEDKHTEASEENIINLHETLRELILLVEKGSRKKAKKIHLYLAPEWKYELFKDASSGKQIGELLRAQKYAEHKFEIENMASKLRAIPGVLLSRNKEFAVLEDAKMFFEKEFGVIFEIQKETTFDHQNTAKFSLPGKPAVFVEVE